MEKERCDGCRFYLKLEDYDGLCRRYPPTREDPDNDGGLYPRHPLVLGDSWCGEYQPAATHRHPLDVAPDPTAVALELANVTAPEDRTILSALYDLSVAARNRRLAAQGVTP